MLVPSILKIATEAARPSLPGVSIDRLFIVRWTISTSAYRRDLSQHSHLQQLRKERSDGKTMDKRKQLLDDLREGKY